MKFLHNNGAEINVKNSKGQTPILTGKSFSEALIRASTNQQYDKRLFIELQVQYMKIARSENVVCIDCSECQNKDKKPICVHNMF